MKASAEMALFQQNQHETEIAAIELAPVSRGAIGSGYTLPPVEIPKAAAEPVAIRAGTSGNSLRVFGPELEVWDTSIVNQSMKPYRNTTEEKEVEKWREKGNGRIECDVVNEQDVSIMVLGADTDSCAPDLVDPR